MRWILCLMLCAVCWNATPVQSEEPAEQTPEQALAPVLEQLRENDLSRAFAEISILGLSHITADENEEAVTRLKKQRQSCGKSLGEVELIDTTKVGSRTVRFTYLEYFERRLLVWRFTMYRGSKQSRLIGVNWTFEVDDLFDKSKQLAQKPENVKR